MALLVHDRLLLALHLCHLTHLLVNVLFVVGDFRVDGEENGELVLHLAKGCSAGGSQFVLNIQLVRHTVGRRGRLRFKLGKRGRSCDLVGIHECEALTLIVAVLLFAAFDANELVLRVVVDKRYFYEILKGVPRQASADVALNGVGGSAAASVFLYCDLPCCIQLHHHCRPSCSDSVALGTLQQARRAVVAQRRRITVIDLDRSILSNGRTRQARVARLGSNRLRRISAGM